MLTAFRSSPNGYVLLFIAVLIIQAVFAGVHASAEAAGGSVPKLVSVGSGQTAAACWKSRLQGTDMQHSDICLQYPA